MATSPKIILARNYIAHTFFKHDNIKANIKNPKWNDPRHL